MKILKALLIIIIIVFIIFFFIYRAFFDMSSLPVGTYLEEASSPDNRYTIKAYLISEALSAECIRCELIDNHTSSTRNIYWGYREWVVEITWLDDTTVEINNRALNVLYETYDFRKD